eukprot:gene286-411_t
MIAVDCRARTIREAGQRAAARKAKKREVFKRELGVGDYSAFNAALRLAPGRLADIQDVLVAHLAMMKEPEVREKGRIGAEGLRGAEDWRAGAKEIWTHYARPRPRPPAKITGLAAAVQFQSVGNSRLNNTDFAKAVPEVMRFPDHEVEFFQSPVTTQEVAKAIRDLRPTGAPDAHGLVMQVLRHTDMGNKKTLADAINIEIDENQLGEKGEIHRCRCVAMFKGGGGSRTEPADHRYLVISGVIIKLTQQILSLRIYDIAERINLHPPTACGSGSGGGLISARKQR